MISDIITGITDAIYSEFGDDYEIHKERVEQGLVEPCFFVMLVNPTNERFLSNRRYLTNKFSIQYFPSTSTPKIECAEVFERLVIALDRIKVSDDLLNGTEFEMSINDDVMTVLVNYNLFTVTTDDTETMLTLETESQVKKDE